MTYYIYVELGVGKMIGIITKDRARYLTCRQWSIVKGYKQRIFLQEETNVPLLPEQSF